MLDKCKSIKWETLLLKCISALLEVMSALCMTEVRHDMSSVYSKYAIIYYLPSP